MRKVTYMLAIFGFIILGGALFFFIFKGITPGTSSSSNPSFSAQQNEIIMEKNKVQLPEPLKEGGMSLTKALTLRRSVRSYSREPMNVSEVSQLLWSAQGVTHEKGFRTAPSAGATFPLEMYVMINKVTGLEKGVYHYNPFENTLERVMEEDVSAALARASLSQSMITEGAVVFIFGAVIERTQARYGERAERYVYNEIGHASQNVHLQAAAMNLGTVVIGAYRDDEVEEILQLGEDVRVLYMMPVGKMN